MGYAEDISKIVCVWFQSILGLKELYGWEMMDPNMDTTRTRKQLSWSMQTHMDEPNFDVCEESCVSRRVKKAPQSRHITIKPTLMSDEQVGNDLVKVSTKVARRNINKAATIRVLLEDNKAKTAEITRLKGEKDLEQKNNEAFISMKKEIGDYVMKARPHLESKVLENFPSAMHYVHTLVDLVLEDGPIQMLVPKVPEQEAERARAFVVNKNLKL